MNTYSFKVVIIRIVGRIILATVVTTPIILELQGKYIRYRTKRSEIFGTILKNDQGKYNKINPNNQSLRNNRL
jgi:hypothetical protein